MHLIFIRHTDYDNPDKIYPFNLPVSLSKKGILHARRIGTWLKINHYEKTPIFTSPIKRTMETANIIAEITKSNVKIENKLTEVKWSKLKGKPMPKNEDWRECYKPGMQESPTSILNRILTVYNKYSQKKNSSIFITHGDNITLLFLRLTGKKQTQLLDLDKNYFEKGEMLLIEINNQKITKINRIKI